MDPDNPIADSFIVEDGRFVYVGNTKPADHDASTDLGGNTVVPGFNDNHIHAVSFGEYASRPDLMGLNSSEIIGKLKAHYKAILDRNHGTKRQGAGSVLITGHRWDYPSCPSPDKRILDKAFPDNPVVLFQYGGHAGWANSRALSLMKINRTKPDPPGVEVIRDKDNEPTGIVDEVIHTGYVMRNYRRKFIDKELNARYLGHALTEFSRHGVTSVQDNSWSPVTVRNLKGLEKQGALSARFSCWSYGDSPLYSRIMALSPPDGERYHRGPSKHFIDGMFSAQTAWLSEPYATGGTNCGKGKSSKDLLTILKRAYRMHRQAAFHAIGDRAVSEFLDAVEMLYDRYPDAHALRFRIEHAQLINPDDVPRLKDLGIIISAQPSALIAPEKDIKLLGESRAERAYPYRTLIRRGIPLSFGSDFPGESTFPPLENIHLAVNRHGPESIDAEDALKAYTTGSAYAEVQEGSKGMIKPGMVADFAVLSADPVSVQPETIKNIHVVHTYVDGAEV